MNAPSANRNRRTKWDRLDKRGKKKIKHARIGPYLYCEHRTGSGMRTWICPRPDNFGRNCRPQTIWNSPALQHCMDRFYAEIDRRLAMSEKRGRAN